MTLREEQSKQRSDADAAEESDDEDNLQFREWAKKVIPGAARFRQSLALPSALELRDMRFAHPSGATDSSKCESADALRRIV